MKKIILLIIFTVILVGCSWNKQPQLSHTIEFIEDTTISYNKKMDSSELIISVDNISINRNNIEGNKLYISNFYVTCPNIPETLGQHHLIYKIGNERYGLDIEVKDLESPVIQLKKSNYLLEIGQELKLSQVQYSVTDNYSNQNKIKIELNKSSNHYVLKATDESGNHSSQKILVKFKEEPVKKAPKKTIDKKDEVKKTQKSKKTSTVKPVSKIFTVKQYKTLKECEKKCIAYIERCSYSGTARAVPIMKDGIYVGYKAIFN